MSGGEFDSVLRAMGGVDALIDWSVKSPEIDLLTARRRLACR